jgi:hypothetical protein
MAERGVMEFLGYYERGKSKWILAHGKSGYATLYMGPEEESTHIPGYIRRPYKITKLKQPRKKPEIAKPTKAAARTNATARTKTSTSTRTRTRTSSRRPKSPK